MHRTITQPAAVLFTALVFAFSAQAVSAATLKFDPTSITATNGNTFEVDIIVDAGADQIAGTDAYIQYDNTLLEPSEVVPGTFFPVVSNSTTSEQVYINGVVTDPTDFKTGSGVLATVTFRMLTDGDGTLSFYCDTTQPNTSKIVKNDVNATNVIECNALTLFSINGGDTPQDSTLTATPAPTALPATGGGVKTSAQQVTTTTTLPESGVFENVIGFAVPGALLLAAGVILKLFI